MASLAQQAGGELIRRQSLGAIVARACATCGAPSRYLSDDVIRVGWPGCWVPPHDPAVNSAVGTACPNCNSLRRPDEDKGEIWSRERRAAPEPPPRWMVLAIYTVVWPPVYLFALLRALYRIILRRGL